MNLNLTPSDPGPRWNQRGEQSDLLLRADKRRGLKSFQVGTQNPPLFTVTDHNLHKAQTRYGNVDLHLFIPLWEEQNTKESQFLN